MRKVTISAVQMDIRSGDLRVNVERAFRFIEKAGERGSDLIVLPEMWPLGFDYDQMKSMPPSYIDDILSLLKDACVKYKTHIIAGTVGEVDNGRYFNTSFFLDEKGSPMGRYRKMHLFKEIGEKDFFTAGDDVKIFDAKFGRTGIAVCYDLRFPEIFRSMAMTGAEIICVPAQFPNPRLEHWEVLLCARAIENQLFMVGVNRVGKSGKTEYFGHSMIVGPYGEVYAQAGDGEEVITETIDIEKMYEIRQVLPTITERRPEAYQGSPFPEPEASAYSKEIYKDIYTEPAKQKESPFKFKDTIQPMKPRQ